MDLRSTLSPWVSGLHSHHGSPVYTLTMGLRSTLSPWVSGRHSHHGSPVYTLTMSPLSPLVSSPTVRLHSHHGSRLHLELQDRGSPRQHYIKSPKLLPWVSPMSSAPRPWVYS
ncbi:MAG: hypothetical protein M1840_009043 [Geoglossum simile]|nr:MAG: hypothetical protein M1840_009043 [Geoglossum simile]